MPITLPSTSQIPIYQHAGESYSHLPEVSEKTVTISGSNFGTAPNVVFYRDFSNGIPGNPVPMENTEVTDIGTVTQSGVFYERMAGKTGFTINNQFNGSTGRFDVSLPNITNFHIMYEKGVPFNKLYPDTVTKEPRDFGTTSSLKSAWFKNIHPQDGDIADLVVPSKIAGSGTHSITGNRVRVVGELDSGHQMWSGASEADDHWEWDNWNGFEVIISTDPNDLRGGVKDQHWLFTNRKQGGSKLDFTKIRTWEAAGFQNPNENIPVGQEFFNQLEFSWQRGNNERGRDVRMCYTNIYVAASDDSTKNEHKQITFLGNSNILENCTARKAKVADSWSNTEVTVTVSGEEQKRYTHLYVMRDDLTYEVREI